MSIFEKKQQKVELLVSISIFATNLRNAREAKGITQEEAAKALGTENHSRVTNWEIGNAVPKLVDLVRLCEIYETTPNDLLGF